MARTYIMDAFFGRLIPQKSRKPQVWQWEPRSPSYGSSSHPTTRTPSFSCGGFFIHSSHSTWVVERCTFCTSDGLRPPLPSATFPRSSSREVRICWHPFLGLNPPNQRVKERAPIAGGPNLPSWRRIRSIDPTRLG